MDRFGVWPDAGEFAGAEQPTSRIVRPIDETEVVTLQGNVHPLARGEFDRGAVSGEMRLEQLVLELEPSSTQQAELDALVERSMIRRLPSIGIG